MEKKKIEARITKRLIDYLPKGLYDSVRQVSCFAHWESLYLLLAHSNSKRVGNKV